MAAVAETGTSAGEPAESKASVGLAEMWDGNKGNEATTATISTRASKNVREESQLETTMVKVKKEKPPTPTLPVSCSQQQPVRLHHQRSSVQSLPSSSLTNGQLRSKEIVQEVLRSSKFNNLSHLTPAAKHEAVRLVVEDSISEESRCRVQETFSQIEQMKVEEKLLLYLKLSVSLTNPNSAVDPLRQPLNPLGNRYEIHQTIMWIKTHLEEDPDVSLPKQEVYDEYNIFCSNNSMKPLSTADFGKVMKQVYPRVRPRRLGTRGNSRYCYSGMRKRIKLNPPTLPSMNDVDVDEDFENNVAEEMLGAASTLIREWAESLVDIKFPTLCSLGKYLVNNFFVNNRSLAAVCILSTSGESQSVANKGTSPGLPVTPTSAKIGKLREVQLQLQRKLQQREQTRDLKDQQVNTVLPVDVKENTIYQNNDSKDIGIKKCKRGKVTNVSHLVQGTNNTSSKTNSNNASSLTIVTSVGRQKRVLKSSNQSCSDVSVLQSNSCDNLVVQSLQANEQISSASPRLVRSNSAQSPREVKPRNTRKRAGSSTAAGTASMATMTTTFESSPEKQLKLSDMLDNSAHSIPMLSSTPIHSHKQQQQHHAKMPVILASNPKADKSNKTSGETLLAATLVNQTPKSCDKDSFLYSNDYSKSNGHATNIMNKPSQILSKDRLQLLSDSSNSSHVFKNKLGNIDSDTLNDYLNGGNNSQEQEEELLQYFQPSNSSSSDMELSNVASEAEISSRQEDPQVSQLRIILQENLQDSVLGAGKPRLQSAPVDKQQALQKHNLIIPTLLNAHGNAVNTRRRVSFETSAVEYSQDSGHGTSTAGSSCSTSNTVPQSPNTRRRIFNFTPISPGPHSPINGRASKSSSANASPFVSPRNTPVPRSRSNLQSNCRTRSAQKTLARSISCNVPCSNVRSDNFIVPISTPELNGISSRPLQSPVASLINNKASQATMPLAHSPLPEQACKAQSLSFTPLLSDLGTQEDQLLINYPSQENLQEIKSVYSQKPRPTVREISDLLQSKQQQQQYAKDQLFYNRSQSVPLHRMVNPALLSPISVGHQMTSSFQYHSFNPSTNSSIAPTPVPSEFNDFSSISGACDSSSYLLDRLVSATDPDFLIEGKEMTSENLNNIFDMLNEADPETILSDDGTIDKDRTIESSSLMMDSLGNANLNEGLLLGDNSALLDSWTNDNGLSSSSSSGTGLIAAAPKLMHSHSYPNTPVPLPNSSSSSLVIQQYPDDSNGSHHSYPTTPLHSLQQQQQQQQQDAYAESNEPMLFNSSLNARSLGLPNHQSKTEMSAGSGCCSTSIECNVADFLEQQPNDEADDLGSLANFDGLQDVDALSPLFNEVVEPNH